MRLLHLPLHCWSSNGLESIGNKLGKYIGRADRKEQFSCARICVEVDLEIGLPEAIKLTIVEWSHIQEVDYEKIPFKCRLCHGYGHFPRNCKKKSEDEKVIEKEDQWLQVQKAGNQNQGSRRKGKENKSTASDSADGKPHPAPQVVIPPNPSSNQFDALNSVSLEEGEMQQLDGDELEVIPVAQTVPHEQSDPPPSSATLWAGGPSHCSPIGENSPPSYANIARKQIDSPNSSEDDQISKKGGRKSKKEIREEEVERLKTQGSQSTIEMSYGRNKRTGPPKGVGTPSQLGK